MRNSAILALILMVAATGLTACEPPDAGGGGGLGGRLALIRKGSLVVSDDDGANEQSLTADDTSAEPAFSPNGQSIAFLYSTDTTSGARKGVYRMGLADQEPDALAEPAAGQEFSAPTWNAAGTKVYFVDEAAGGRLMEVSASEGGAAAAVANVPDNIHFPAAISDTLLVVLKGQDVGTLDVGTGVFTSLGVTSISRACVSSDGKVAFASNEGGGRIVVIDRATKAQTKLASSGGSGDVKPSFAPTGTHVAFESGGKIYASKADGTGTVTPMQSGTDISWGQ